jgi:hypothetical protein
MSHIAAPEDLVVPCLGVRQRIVQAQTNRDVGDQK